MTLNTLEDFEIQQKIFAAIIKENPNFAIRKIIKWLNSDFEILVMVKNEIFRNQKYESLITAFTIW